MGNSAPILMVLSCACAVVTKRPTAAAPTTRLRNTFILSSPHKIRWAKAYQPMGNSVKQLADEWPTAAQNKRVGFSHKLAVTLRHDVPRKPAHHRPLRAQHGPGLSGPRRG